MGVGGEGGAREGGGGEGADPESGNSPPILPCLTRENRTEPPPLGARPQHVIESRIGDKVHALCVHIVL